MRSPFKFLDPFTLEDRDSFFGREKEVEQLYAMVNQNRLILVYGPSGTGKTSLVQCGLASQFETVDWYPIFIRKGEDINRSLDEALQKALKGELFDTYEETIEELYAQYVRPIYLLFDQFEELFILGSPEEQAAFFKTISTLVSARLPCRILFILREEYLAHLYEFERVVPTLLDRRLRVEPMSYKNVGEVIQRSCSRFNISLEDAETNTEQIIQNLSSGSSGIHLPYLQVYLDMLYREDYRRTYGKAEVGNRKPESPAAPPSAFPLPTSDFDYPPLTFTTEEIAELGEIDNVLDKFLEEQSLTLQAEMEGRHPGFPENGVHRILDLFVTEEGTKRPINYTRSEGLILLPDKALERIPGIEAPALSESLQRLENMRLLRITDDNIELPHDTLAILIDQKRTDKERQLNAVLRQLKAAYAAYGRTREYLTRKQLNAYEDFLPKLALDEGILGFIADSRAHVEALEKEEQERRERELELTRQKLEAEQRAARRQRIFTGLIGIALVAMAGLAIWAYGQQQKAKENAAFAEVKSEEAIRSAKDAEEQRRQALAQKNLADSSAQVATTESERARQASIRAEENLQKARAEEAKATAALAQVKKEQAATEKQRQIAEENARLAQEATKQAEEQRDNAQAALDELEKSNAEVARLILQNADKDILSLDYPAALENIKAASSLGTLKEEVAKSYLELAFWFGESGQAQRAVGILDSAAQLVNNKAVPELLQALPQDTAAAREKIKEAIKLLDKGAFDTLWERYYPVMVEVKGDTFLMGSSKYDDEKPHTASVSTFLIAKHETTWWQYALFCQATGRQYERPGWGTDGDNPVVNVSWYDAVEYANWVNGQLGFEEAVKKDGGNYSVNLKSNGFRLPTEAEWEYAARGGIQKSPYTYAGSDEVGVVAWYYENSESRTQPVGKKKPNALGIHDMSGNVWEWCWDWRDEYLDNPPLDYKGPPSGSDRVLRGGSWNYSPDGARCADRDIFSPDLRFFNIGFRLARTGGQ